jgi:hypothetical protein
VVVIVNNEINIHIDTCVDIDICGTTPDGNVIIIVIEGCIDTTCVPVEVPVTVINICFDINFFTIIPVTVPDIECPVFDNGCSWTHEDFILQATTQVIFEMCVVVYTVDAGDVDIYITYDIDLHVLIFYCEDMSLIDSSFTYTIIVTIDGFDGDCNYCGGCCHGSTGTIVIIDPCINPVIEIGIVIDIDFSFNGPSIWNPPPCNVIPPVCQN